jgi:MFS family permease
MKRINRIIKILIASDVIFQVGMGFVTPVFAIFLVQSIENGSAKVVGLAAAILLVTKSLIRLPVAWFLDKKRGEYDDFYCMLAGFTVISGCFFLYLLAKTPLHIYGIQLLLGVAGAFAFTPWYGFFSRHIDKRRENFEWGVEISAAGFAMALASFLAGIIVDDFGFAPIFVIAGILSLAGTIFLAAIGKAIKLKRIDGYTLISKDKDPSS